jgi:hypothetical protein
MISLGGLNSIRIKLGILPLASASPGRIGPHGPLKSPVGAFNGTVVAFHASQKYWLHPLQLL